MSKVFSVILFYSTRTQIKANLQSGLYDGGKAELGQERIFSGSTVVAGDGNFGRFSIQLNN